MSSQISTNTGIAPVLTIAETVGIAVFETVITSSPSPIFKALSAKKIASVPLATPMPCLASQNAAYCSSKFFTFEPNISHPESKTSSIADNISFFS